LELYNSGNNNNQKRKTVLPIPQQHFSLNAYHKYMQPDDRRIDYIFIFFPNNIFSKEFNIRQGNPPSFLSSLNVLTT